ncbi:MAG: glycosyltransferase [Pseudomonadota bacterium]
MRILHLAPRLSDRGGADRDLLALLDLLGAQHHQVLITSQHDEPPELPSSLEIEVVPGLDARDAQTVDLDALVARHKPDLIHAHNLMNPALLESAAAAGALLTVQDHRFLCPGRGKWTAAGEVCGAPLDRARCRACFDDEGYFCGLWELTTQRLRAAQKMRAVSVLSFYMRAQLVDAGVDADRLHVIPPFAHALDVLAVPEVPPCVLFVGRVVDSKGVRDAIVSWRRSGLDLPFRIAGTGRLRNAVVAEGVEVLGWVGRSRLSSLYRAAQVLVLPSRWQEPFGIVGLEALSLGVPVAAWHSGGVAEWHPGGAGLVAWGDVEGLALALRDLAGTRMALRPGFTREDALARWSALYTSLGVKQRESGGSP